MRSSLFIAAAATLSTASASIQGFNYGSAKTDGSFMFEADFKSKFNTAKNLVGASGFSSARLYTMIQGGSSTNEPTQAIPAAIAEDTTLLLGLWASGGQDGLNAELTALSSAISQWGDDFTKLVVGISVGSEDLYRETPAGIASDAGNGADAATISSFIKQVRTAISKTSLKNAPVGHVDTWTGWVNSSNTEVIENCDWIGFDGYPYFQNTDDNSIENAKALFQESVAATQQAAKGKDIWITETGWPVSGPKENLGVASTNNAKTYWDEVGCSLLFGSVNTWWYTLQDADPKVPSPSFGLVGSTLSTTPLFDLSCKDVSKSSSSSASASGSASSSSGSKPTSSVKAGTSTKSSEAPSSTTDSGSSGSSSSTETPVSSGGSIPTTIQTSGTSPSGSSGSSSPSPSSSIIPASGASALTGSLIAAAGAIFAAVAAL